MTALSLLLTLLSFFAFWLIIPSFILLPLAVVCGCRAYAARRERHVLAGGLRRMLWCVPIVLPIAAFVLQMFALMTEYNP